MTRRTKKSESFSIPADLDAASVVPVHRELVALLDKVSGGAASTTIELAESDCVSPLSLQLLASAAKSFPDQKMQFGANATAAMETFEPSKEN